MNHLQKKQLESQLSLPLTNQSRPKEPPRPPRSVALLFAMLMAALLVFIAPDYTRGQADQKEAAKKAATRGTNAPVPTAETDSSTNSAGSSSTTNAAGALSSKETKPSDKDKSSSTNEIQLSFQGANVDMIAQWLAQNTGKSVIKHPRVQCQLTIVGSKKLTPREAVNLVYRALAMEGFTAIESSNSILIVPEGSEPKLSPEFLSASRTDVPEGRQRLVKIFPLKHIQATEAKEKIKGVLTEKGTIDTDDRANQIIVTDYNDNLVLVGQLLNMLDSEKAQDVTMRVIPLKHVSAQDLVKEISPVYQKMNAKSPKDSVEVTANDRSNSLIIFSSEANFKAIQEVVAMLDTEEASEKILRAFPLKNAEAMDAAKQLQDLYQDQDANANRYGYYYGPSSGSSKNTKKMSVVADRRRNTLMVQAAPAAMEGIAKMIEAIDEPITDDTLAPKIFALKYVSAGDIEDILNELFLKKQNQRTYWNPFGDGYESSSVDRDVGRLYGKVRITSEPHANAIILTSNSAENMAAVEAVIKQLDVPSEAGDTTLRIGLNFAKAMTVANSMNILFAKGGSPGLRQNPQQNQQGPVGQLQQAAQNYQGPSEFELGQDVKEDGYFPWLGGQPENTGRSTDGRATVRPVSDLVGRVRVVADQRSNSLLISANVHFFPQVLKLIEELDAPTAQVLIEARIVEVASDFLEKLGVRWSPDGSKVFTADDFDNSVLLRTKGEYIKTFGGPVAAALANSLHSGVIDTTMNLDFLIQFLRKTTEATVLAQPQLNIADNELGKLFVGQQVPFIDRSLSTDVGGLNQSFSYKNVGIILDVTPHINTSGDVAMKVRVESSAIVPGQTLFGGAILDTRNFKTDLTVKNGQTMVLGGIIQKQLSKTVRKVPYLGDIPGLKWAFRKNDDLTHEVELMVFLQPKVVRTPQEAKEMLQEIDRRAPRIRQWLDDNQPPPAGATPPKH
jgi:type II secretion system protein D